MRLIGEGPVGTKFASYWALALMAASLAALGDGAFAQSGEATEQEIMVEAPRTVPVPVERSPHTGAAIAVTTVRRRCSTAIST